MNKNGFLLCISFVMMISASSLGGYHDAGLFSNEGNQAIIMMDTNETMQNEPNTNIMNIQIGNTTLTATLVNNSSAEALKDVLAEGPITINMRDYGNMEKVGSLGRDFPRNDESITAQAGDIILYQGSALVIYYDRNAWNFTRLGRIDNVTAEELKEILGDGNVSVTLSLP